MRISDWSSDVCSSDLITLKILTQACHHRTHGVGRTALAHQGQRELMGAHREAFVVLRGGEQLVQASIEFAVLVAQRSEEHTSELQSLMRISYAVFCLKKNNTLIY